MAALLKLAEVQQQQAASLQSLERLTEQHREWRSVVEELVQQVQALQAQPQRLETVQESEEMERDEDLAKKGSTSISSLNSMNSIITSPEKKLNRSMSNNSLLRSRTTVAQDFPAGPLRKVVVEVLEDDTTQVLPPDTWWAYLRYRAAEVVRSRWFEFTAGFVILMNLITIGIEAHLSVTNNTLFAGDFWPGGVERIFLALYCIEAGVRVLGGGWATFKDCWFLMDMLLILVGLLSLLVIPALSTNPDVAFERMLVVRGLRLFRLVRALRMLSHFKIVWRLVYGLLTAGQTMLSMTMLIAVSLFVFACVAVELIAKDEHLQHHPDTQTVVQENFWGLDRSFLTLLQFVTLDDVSDVYYPLVYEKPYLCGFFFPILIFISIGLMNLVTASLVENAMQTAASEEAEERLKLKKKVKGALPSLIEIFHQLDADQSGLITHDEVENVPVTVLPPRVLDSICVENMAEIFDYLDVDGTGYLTQMEFVEGLLNLCLLDMPISTIQCLKLLQLLRNGMGQVNQKLAHIAEQLEINDSGVINSARV